MSIREQIMFLGAILFVVILLSLSMPSIVPYHKDSLFSQEFPYEGFATLSPAELQTPGNIVKKVEGFQGLQTTPLGPSEKLDIFSDFEGKMSCTPSSYSNSKGYLCMDEKATKLLLTRGGNATGKPSEIA